MSVFPADNCAGFTYVIFYFCTELGMCFGYGCNEQSLCECVVIHFSRLLGLLFDASDCRVFYQIYSFCRSVAAE